MPKTERRTRRHNGAAIRALRTARGMKPAELANKSLVAYSTLDNIEKERKEASLEALYRIAAALNCDIEAIVRHPDYAVAGATAEDVA